MSVLHNLICPLDNLPLELRDGALVCPDNHSFDLAKTGYVNLLPVQHKHSKDPGDNKEMVMARQRFLNTCAYQPIANILYEHVQQKISGLSGPSFSLLDAGCGEGYYLDYLQQQYSNKLLDSIGLDISKWAVVAASKRNKKLGWIVGSNACLPTPTARFDGILCLFGFPVWQEFHRVLKEGGFVILANAGPKHLLELREILYPEIRPYSPTDYSEIDGFTAESTQHLEFVFEVQSNESIMDLLSMTPHRYKVAYERRQMLEKYERLTLTADVTFTCLRKKAM